MLPLSWSEFPHDILRKGNHKWHSHPQQEMRRCCYDISSEDFVSLGTSFLIRKSVLFISLQKPKLFQSALDGAFGALHRFCYFGQWQLLMV